VTPPRAALVRGAAAAAVLVTAAVVWTAFADRVRHHPYFTVREVAIRRAHHLSAAEIRAAAGIEPGMSIWDVDRARGEAGLVRRPWVREARVERALPHRVVIRVREHRPVAIVATAGPAPALYYVSARGDVFAPVGAGDPRDFPYLTGLAAADLQPGATFAPRAIRQALALLRVVERGQTGIDAVSEIQIDQVRGLTLLPTRPRFPLEVGWDDYQSKLARLAEVLALWKGREAEVAAVSLRFEDEVIVRTRSQPAAPSRRAATT